MPFSLRWPILLLTIALHSCISNTRHSDVRPFPGLPDFSAEAEQLNAAGAKSVKTVFREDGTSQTLTITPDWTKELGPFLSVDVNQAKYRDAFQINDTTSGKTRILQLKAKNQAQEVQELEAIFRNDSLQVIKILRERSSVVSESRQLMTYAPGKFYSIDVLQEVDYVMSYKQKVRGEIILE